MPIVRNDVRKGVYLDSVALMRMSRTVAAMDGVVECGMMMATPANRRIMADAGVLGPEGEAAAAGDLVIAVSAVDATAADAAMAQARLLLDAPKRSGDAASAWAPRTLRAAAAADPAANVVLISVPGAFAAAEARKALARGLNVMMFSDNVPIEEEIALKTEARRRGLLVMGPDCGTAIIGGVPLAFANVVPRGDIGIVGASGTGIQEVSCLVARAGRGISHAIGTGGRDLKADVGGISMLTGIDLLDADPATSHIVLISKPPADAVARVVLERAGRSRKPFTVCFVGGADMPVPANVRMVSTLRAAAVSATGSAAAPAPPPIASPARARGGRIRGLFAGGTLCAEAQVVLRDRGHALASNAAIPGVVDLDAAAGRDILIDLGDDDYTQGRPHPMIEPAVRDKPLADALADPGTAVVLIDVVLGLGGHMDPAGHLARTLAARGVAAPIVVAAVTGTDADPQGLQAQVAALSAAGVRVAPSMAEAATWASIYARDF